MSVGGLRHQLKTPALVLDIDILDQNIATMFDRARAMGVGLRPHAKAHKCVEIAKRLQRAGALGASCATIDEAECLAAGGITGILVTSPMVSQDQVARLGGLLARGADLMVVMDNPLNLSACAGVAAEAGRTLGVLIDFDFGQGRTGCIDAQDAVSLARGVSASAHLRLRGVQAYWGQVQQIMPIADRRRQAQVQLDRLKDLVSELTEAGLKPEIVSGGGTGTHQIDGESGLFTELQPGSFLFLDSQYDKSVGAPFKPSLFVALSVVSANRPGRVIVNGGYKAFATDGGFPEAVRGAPSKATYRYMGDEHGALDFNGEGVTLGATIEFLTSHCDPTVNLHPAFHVVRGENVIDVWPIGGRYS